MIKTLLLATTCVIGSGAGALQNNAPVFNHEHMQITGSNNSQTIYIDLTTNEFSKTRYNPGNYMTGKQQESNNYKSFVDIEYTFVARNGFIDVRNPDYTFEDNVYTDWYFIKITPYYDYSSMNYKTTFINNVDCAVEQDMYTGVIMNSYITTDTKSQQIFNQYNYADASYQPLNIFTAQEKTNMLKNNAYIWTYFDYGETEQIQYENNNQSTGTNIFYEQYNDANGSWQKFRGSWENNYVINNSRQPIYILQEYTYRIDASPNTTTPIDPNGTNYLNTSLQLNLTTPIPTEEPTDYEVVDIGGLMFDILTMPFTFVSRAFNITLFPNTPYQLNISGLFLSIFAALVFIWIIKKFIKK